MASKIFRNIYNKILTYDQKQRIKVGEKYVVTLKFTDLGGSISDLTTTVEQVNRGKFEVESMIIKEYYVGNNGEEEIEYIDSITETKDDSYLILKASIDNWDDSSLLNFDVTPYEKYMERLALTPETKRYFIHCSPSGYIIK